MSHLHRFKVRASRLRESLTATFAVHAGLLAFLIGLAGCQVGPKYTSPSLAAAPPSLYKENQPRSEEAKTNGWRQANPQDALLRGKWWESFGDPDLNALEEKLVINNQNIKQYFQNYMAARALVRNARASLFPSISVAPSFTIQGTGSSSTATATTGSGNSSTVISSSANQSYSLPVNASWEPDLFGSIRNTIREDANAAQVSAATLANETLSEQSSLAQYYFELRGQDALQELYNSTISTYRESLSLTQALLRTGIDSEQDVAQAETNLRAAEANATSVATTRAQYEHAIALLTGEAAGSFSLPARSFKVTPPYIPSGVPSQLLERRPDIAAAERTMAEANALIGVGKAAYYPTISISASGGTQSSDITELLNLNAGFWSLGTTATETLVDFGARRATVQRYQAQYNADVASYRQTVLNAFKEVEDYLVASRQLAEQTKREQLAIDAAQHYERLANVRYKLGVDTYLNVLTAQNNVLTSRQTLVTLETSRMTNAVQLIASLGGGWDVTELPSVKQVTVKP